MIYEEINSPVIEGREGTSDLSNEWVDEMCEIRKLENGIPIFQFNEAIKNRKQDMEFRVINNAIRSIFGVAKMPRGIPT